MHALNWLDGRISHMTQSGARCHTNDWQWKSYHTIVLRASHKIHIALSVEEDWNHFVTEWLSQITINDNVWQITAHETVTLIQCDNVTMWQTKCNSVTRSLGPTATVWFIGSTRRGIQTFSSHLKEQKQKMIADLKTEFALVFTSWFADSDLSELAMLSSEEALRESQV